MYKIIDTSKTIREDNKPEYKVTVASKYGIFSSTASPCDVDMELASDWTGYILAEYKNNIKIHQAKASILRERMNGIKHAYNVLVEQFNAKHNDLQHSENFLKSLERQYYIAKREYEKAYIKYLDLLHSYDNIVEKRLAQTKEAREYHNKNKNK